MLRALVGLLCVIGVLHSSIALSAIPSTSPASAVFLRQQEVIDYMKESFPKVEVEVVWKPCRKYNAYYDPNDRTIVLCTEMEDFPEVAVLVAAHEMGHAITDQMLDEMSEYDADELAALALIAKDDLLPLVTAGVYFKRKELQGHMAGDPHPSAGYRAWFFECMGSVDTDSGCAEMALDTALKWALKLDVYHD